MTNGVAARIALASLVVTGTAVAAISLGVLVLSASAFERLMGAHGMAVDEARRMFDESVTGVYLVATAAGALGSIALAVILARWLTRPLARISAAARRLAGGERDVRVPAEGPAEIASLAESFNQMAARLEEQERMRAEFVANAAHELRTPLTNLLGYLEALRDGVVAPTTDTFSSLREEVERLVRLSRSLDDLAVGDREREVPTTDLDLRDAIEMAAELAMPAYERAGVTISLHVPRGLRARANADHLAQVLANLLQNAVRYTPAGGRVTITAMAEERMALVSVANTGAEIPAADLAHVFERFYRVEKSRDRARGGAGIGLAIVKQLIELGGGTVGVDSGDGVTRFWFRVPAGL